MRNSWRKLYRQFFKYQKSDRNAVLILAGLLLVVLVLSAVVPWFVKPVERDFSELEALVEAWQKEEAAKNQSSEQVLFSFDPNRISESQLDSFKLPARVKRNMLNYRKAGGRFTKAADVRKIYGMNDSIFNAIKSYIVIAAPKPSLVSEVQTPKTEVLHFNGNIDPNRDSYQRLVAFGLSEFQASNLVRYREKGGVFRHRNDLLKIYGVDSLFFAKISPHIIIDTVDVSPSFAKTDDIPVVELNSADTTALKALPGIGSVFAARIVKYRNLLGGFCSTRQLLEVYHFPEQTYKRIEKFLTVDTTKVQQLRINFCDYSELLRHPYLRKEQVGELIDAREKRGAFKHLDEVQALPAFDSSTFAAVRPYLSCR